MKNHPHLTVLTLLLSVYSLAYSQEVKYDLQQLLKENKFARYGESMVPITDSGKKGIALTGIAWLKGVNFSEGTIEVDLRGRDEFQKSFIGIVFHGVDTSAYDIIYFRPFNFLSTDPVRKIHAVQYATHPEFPWERLREERNGQYEKALNPAPSPKDWLHARIVIKGNDISVYVNNSDVPSLTVKKLNTRTSGLIGLSNGGVPGDFANLVIKK